MTNVIKYTPNNIFRYVNRYGNIFSVINTNFTVCESNILAAAAHYSAGRKIGYYFSVFGLHTGRVRPIKR